MYGKIDGTIGYKRFVLTIPLMNRFINFSIPVIVAISLALLLNHLDSSQSSYGQIVDDTDQTNQTNGQNSTEQTVQQLEQANQQLAQANQTQQQVSNQTVQPDPKMIEKLLNFTNAAILALNEDDTSAAEDNLGQIQNALINASGKQVVIVPAPAVSTSDEDSD